MSLAEVQSRESFDETLYSLTPLSSGETMLGIHGEVVIRTGLQPAFHDFRMRALERLQDGRVDVLVDRPLRDLLAPVRAHLAGFFIMRLD